MTIERFIGLRPYLYHLTDEENLESILRSGTLKSTATLVQEFHLEDADTFLRTRRVGHKKIIYRNKSVIIRDQDPLFIKILAKNLEGGWTIGDFIHSLNSRVFFWAKEKDMQGHYLRYENQKEFPKILRFSTEDLFKLNDNEPQFCRLNSGAPRCSCYYPEGAPPRGETTFQHADNYKYTPSTVREVTFLSTCTLPKEIFLSSHPTKSFKRT